MGQEFHDVFRLPGRRADGLPALELHFAETALGKPVVLAPLVCRTKRLQTSFGRAGVSAEQAEDVIECVSRGVCVKRTDPVSVLVLDVSGLPQAAKAAISRRFREQATVHEVIKVLAILSGQVIERPNFRLLDLLDFKDLATACCAIMLFEARFAWANRDPDLLVWLPFTRTRQRIVPAAVLSSRSPGYRYFIAWLSFRPTCAALPHWLPRRPSAHHRPTCGFRQAIDHAAVFLPGQIRPPR